MTSALHKIAAATFGKMLGLGAQYEHEHVSAQEVSAADFGGGERVYLKYGTLPVGEEQLRAEGWTKHEGKGCHPRLGYGWSEKQGGPTRRTPLVLYTTESGNPAGVGVVIRNEMPEAQRKWTTAEPVVAYSGSGAVWHVDVAFRSSGVCDQGSSEPGLGEVLVVNPGGAQELKVPLTESEATSSPNPWQRGSCFDGMGFHYLLNTKGDKPPQWSALDLFPIVPMYHEGNINSIFFASISNQVTLPLIAANWWEPSLSDEQFCGNFCGSCGFTEHDDKRWSTMHVYFNSLRDVTCPLSNDECDGPFSGSWRRIKCCPATAMSQR